jgi:phosphate transport system substrate-binding protein
MSRIRRSSAALAAIGVLALAVPTGALASTLITISGATASYPLVALLGAKYTKLLHNKVHFRILQGGTQVGINDVAAGRTTIGDVSRDPLATDPPGLDFYPVAKYAICLVTNSGNHLANLTTAQAVNIFTGKTRNWSEVPGATATGAIDVISRESTAGTLSSLQTLLLEGKKVSSTFQTQSSEGLLRQAVKSDPNAIGFLSNYQAGLGGLNVAGYNGIACNKSTAAAGTYAGVARFYEVTKGRATGAAAKFINWIVHSGAARKIINTQWIPIK